MVQDSITPEGCVIALTMRLKIDRFTAAKPTGVTALLPTSLLSTKSISLYEEADDIIY